MDDKDNVVKTCAMLELPWVMNQRNVSCIPELTYWVEKLAPTEDRPYVHFWVKDVPGRTAILWHPGNYKKDIQGCQLPGIRHSDMNEDGLLDVVNSTAMLAELSNILPIRFQIKIRS
jgi:hypothetical protein